MSNGWRDCEEADCWQADNTAKARSADGLPHLSVPLLIAALSATAWPAAAEPPAGLHWSAPMECPQATTITQKVADLLGEDPAPAALSQFWGSVSQHNSEAAGTEWSAELTSASGSRRTLTARSCVDLSEMAALSIALALNPDLELDEPLRTDRESTPGAALEETASPAKDRAVPAAAPRASSPAQPSVIASSPTGGNIAGEPTSVVAPGSPVPPVVRAP